MAKGDTAKRNVVMKLQEAFGENWIGEYSKKYYVWEQDNGEKIQIAISLTCPKTQVSIVNAPGGENLNFEDDSSNSVVAASGFQPAEITDEERARVNELMARLGL